MCYKYDSTNKTWSEANDSCMESNPLTGSLASIHDNATNDFLTSLTGGSEWTWVGGYQEDDSEVWHWADGSEWTGFNNWGPGQPDNLWGNDDHLGLNYPGTGHWNDFGGDYPQGSICQYDPSEYAVTTSAPAYTCSPAGTQCTKSGFDFTGFEDVDCCHGTVCTPGVGVPTSTSNPFYCNPSEGYESTSAPTSCAPEGTQCWDPETVSPIAGVDSCCDGICAVYNPTKPAFCSSTTTVPTTCAPEGTQCWDPETMSPIAGVDCCDGICAVDSPYEPAFCSYTTTDTPTYGRLKY